MRTLILGLLAVSALGCSSAGTSVGPSSRVQVFGAPLGEPFDIAIGQTATVANTGLRIGFRAVNGDSRCPVDVTCVWAGDAEVELPVERSGQRAVAELHTTLEPRKVEFAGYDIELVALRPENHSGQPIPAEHYIATLRVSTH